MQWIRQHNVIGIDSLVDDSLYKNHTSLFLFEPCFNTGYAVIYSWMKREAQQSLLHVYLFSVSVLIKTTFRVKSILTSNFFCIITFEKFRCINQEKRCDSWQLPKIYMISQSYLFNNPLGLDLSQKLRQGKESWNRGDYLHLIQWGFASKFQF